MPVPQLQSFPGWCAALHCGVLLVVSGAWAGAGDALFRLQARGFRLDRARCDFALYLLPGGYKLAIVLFCLVPWLALRLVRPT
ncbi:MAG TPA: hypothetical protein VLM17_09535 [Xanthomonadaceae bacterium]|nr:hypothetical protein [Xanthomonadaceae bacterium]